MTEPSQQGLRTVGAWALGSHIGAGSFAIVWRARHVHTGQEAAVKEIALSKLNAKLRQSLESEVAILKRIRHENIVQVGREGCDTRCTVLPQGKGDGTAAFERRFAGLLLHLLCGDCVGHGCLQAGSNIPSCLLFSHVQLLEVIEVRADHPPLHVVGQRGVAPCLLCWLDTACQSGSAAALFTV